MIRPVLIFAAFMAFFAFLGGFNFDQRNFHVAFATLMVVICSIAGTAFVEIGLDD